MPPRNRKDSKWNALLDTMKPGNSVVFDEIRALDGFTQCARRRGDKICRRKIGDGHYRAWLLERGKSPVAAKRSAEQIVKK